MLGLELGLGELVGDGEGLVQSPVQLLFPDGIGVGFGAGHPLPLQVVLYEGVGVGSGVGVGDSVWAIAA